MSKAAELAALIGSQSALSNRNLVINGAMQVAQRGTSTTGLQNSGGKFTVDRFAYRRGGTWTNLQVKHEQVDATVPGGPGLTKALKATCTTAEGSAPSSGESTAIGYYFERQDTNPIGPGTSGMLNSVFSFYARASIATTYGIDLIASQHSTTQVVRIPFTIDSADTWQRISVSIPTYTEALDSTADNAVGWQMHIVLDGVSSSQTNSTWVDRSGGIELPNGVSTTAFSNTANATFEVTGVQLELGEQATPFEHRSFGDELARCQRYFYRWLSTGLYTEAWIGGVVTANIARGTFYLPTVMRAGPAISNSGNFRLHEYAGSDYSNISAVSINRNNPLTPYMQCSLDSSPLTVGRLIGFSASNDDDATLDFSAEL